MPWSAPMESHTKHKLPNPAIAKLKTGANIGLKNIVSEILMTLISNPNQKME